MTAFQSYKCFMAKYSIFVANVYVKAKFWALIQSELLFRNQAEQENVQ